MRTKKNTFNSYRKKLSISQQFHQKTSIKKLPKDVNFDDWPEEWKQIYFKQYPRFKKISLQYPKVLGKSIYKTILKRKSQRDFNNYSIGRKELSKLLFYSCGIVQKRSQDWNLSTRSYPSAGARYPLEVYVSVLNSNKLPRGIYHYNVKNHSLEIILEGDMKVKMLDVTAQDWIVKSSVVFIITSVLGRSLVKYSDRAYRFSFLEGGHLAQNLYLISETLKLKCCAIGGFVDHEVNSLLDLNIENEFAIYMLAVGK